MAIDWQDKNHLTINGFPAFAMSDDLPLSVTSQWNDRLFIQKPRAMLDGYRDLVPVDEGRAPNVVEIGMLKGGSAAYLQALLGADKLVGIEKNPEPLSMLAQYREAAGVQDRIIPCLGIDQADTDAIRRVLAREFTPGEIDLVTDDASHYLRETRASFECMFPWLREGGVYVIEDWRWGSTTLDSPKRGVPIKEGVIRKALTGQPPLTILGLQVAMACGSRSDVIREVRFNVDCITVVRGEAPLDPEGFDLNDYYGLFNTEFIGDADRLFPEPL